jgi:hypothetical protein
MKELFLGECKYACTHFSLLGTCTPSILGKCKSALPKQNSYLLNDKNRTYSKIGKGSAVLNL